MGENKCLGLRIGIIIFEKLMQNFIAKISNHAFIYKNGLLSKGKTQKINKISEFLSYFYQHSSVSIIRKTCSSNQYPLKPHFYIVKLGYAGVYLFFLFLLQNIDCGYSLEPPLCFEQK